MVFKKLIWNLTISQGNKTGKKVLYGKLSSTNEIKIFEYDKMCNIKVFFPYEKFSPVIPIIPRLN